eukprot:RCo023356
MFFPSGGSSRLPPYLWERGLLSVFSMGVSSPSDREWRAASSSPGSECPPFFMPSERHFLLFLPAPLIHTPFFPFSRHGSLHLYLLPSRSPSLSAHTGGMR